jgi:hypothetical protein
LGGIAKQNGNTSDDVRPFDLILDVMIGFSAKIGSIVPLGRGYFAHNPRHFVPGTIGLSLRDKK